MESLDRITAAIQPVLARHACDLVLATFRPEGGRLVLRLFIEKLGADPDTGSGVDLHLLSAVSRDVGTTLDAEDVISGQYTLEVSSPGLERPLVRAEDFRRFAGRRAQIAMRAPVGGRKRFQGRLIGCENEMVLLELDDGQRVELAIGNVSKANLALDQQRLFGKAGDE